MTTCDIVLNSSKSFLLLFSNSTSITKLMFLLNSGEKRSYSGCRANDHHRIFPSAVPSHGVDMTDFSRKLDFSCLVKFVSITNNGKTVFSVFFISDRNFRVSINSNVDFSFDFLINNHNEKLMVI